MRHTSIGGLPDRPGSLNALKRLGIAIRDDDAVAIASLHYDEVWSWYNDLVAAAIADIGALDLDAVAGAPVAVTGRAKIRETVREKLRRRPADKLPSIQDLAGVRIEAEMTLSRQDAVAETIIRHFGADNAHLHDLRDGAHAGYRALHVWVRLPHPRGAWLEVQVRTVLQGEWANTYEALADLLGREIRYGDLPPDPQERALVELIQTISRESLATAEASEDLVSRWQSGALDEVALTDRFRRLGVTDPERAASTFVDSDEVPSTVLGVMRDARERVEDLSRLAQEQIRSMSEEGR